MTELIWEGKYKDGKKVAPVRMQCRFLKKPGAQCVADTCAYRIVTIVDKRDDSVASHKPWQS